MTLGSKRRAFGIAIALGAMVAPGRASGWSPISPAALPGYARPASAVDGGGPADGTPGAPEAPQLGRPETAEGPVTPAPVVAAPAAIMPPTRLGATAPAIRQFPSPTPAPAPRPEENRRGARVLLWTFVGALVVTSAAVVVVATQPQYEPYPGTLGTVEIP